MALKELIPHRVTLEPVSHRYYDNDGDEFMSMSKFLSLFKQPFDTEARSWASAGKELKFELGRAPSAVEQAIRQKALKAKWLAKNKDSTDTGTEIHDAIERFIKTGVHDPKYPWVLDMCKKYFPEFSQLFPENCIYSKKYKVAGTSDLPILRNGSKTVIDIFDYKTNKAKGIEYFSTYKNRLLAPLEHLEECSYITYCLQLSGYALMLEEHGWKIGRLAMIYIPPSNPEGHFLIPVPYMKHEVQNMFEYAAHHGKIQVQPQIINVPSIEAQEMVDAFNQDMGIMSEPVLERFGE